VPAFSQIPLPPSGTINITCRVGNAPYERGKILVDSRVIGTCPQASLQVSTGVHTVRAGEALGNDRYMAYQNERVEVQKDSTQNVIATLAPASTENAAGLAYALDAKLIEIGHLDRPDDSKIGVLSPYGEILAVGAETNSIRLYAATDGEPLRRLGVSGAYWVSFVTALSFSADGNLLASNGWLYDSYIGEINLWDMRTGLRVRTIPNVKEVSSLAFSPDGKLLAAGVGINELKVWSVNSGRLLWSARPPGQTDKKISQLKFSADGNLLVAGPNLGEDICVYDVRRAKLQSNLRGNLVTLGKDGKAFTFSYRGSYNTLQSTWNLSTGKLIDSKLLTNTSAVRAINEQNLLAASRNASGLDSRHERLMQALNDPSQIVLTPDGSRWLFYGNQTSILSLPAFPGSGDGHEGEPPTVGFCEMVKNPKLYFDKTVRLLATYQMATEGQYLNDEKCPLSHDGQIGVGHREVIDEKQRDIFNTEIRKISTREYGGRAMVTVVGALRNESRHDFVWYQYRFDIIRLEKISPVIVPYQGVLQGGITYRGMVRGDQEFGLSVNPMPRMNEHYAQRIEWTNLGEFPELKQLRQSSREQQIVFTVLSDEIQQMTVNRWNRTLKCKILRTE